MNIKSEIEFFGDLGLIDKVRFICRIVCEIAEEAKNGPADGNEALRFRFVTEINQRLIRFSYQILSEDMGRPQDDVIIRMLLGARTDKQAERMVHNAYRRVVSNFESFDTTVLLNNR
jgi:hypothetical protein